MAEILSTLAVGALIAMVWLVAGAAFLIHTREPEQ